MNRGAPAAIGTLVVPEIGGVISAGKMGGVDARPGNPKGEVELASAAAVGDVYVTIGFVLGGVGEVV